ncbi:putative protease YhbU precursor [compost metagenome]
MVALKVEGRQRGVAYVRTVARVWREAIDQHTRAAKDWRLREDWQQSLAAHAEGQQTTLGPYHRAWH